jgi:DNA-directed RNA polymerase
MFHQNYYQDGTPTKRPFSKRLFTKRHVNERMIDFSEFPAEHVDASSKYLAKKTFESLNEMFTASQEIQDWLTQCAKVRINR